MARIIFVSHPFSFDPIRNANCVVPVARAIALAGDLPLAPQLYLPQFIDEESERSLAMKLCLEFLARSDEIRVHGQPTDGMRLEIAEAHRLGIPVVVGDREALEGRGVESLQVSP